MYDIKPESINRKKTYQSEDTAKVFGKPIPDSLRCVARKKNCDCGYHFNKWDGYICPKCGRPRQRCKKPRIKGTTVCRSHGGRGVIERAIIPPNLNLTERDYNILQAMIEQNNIELKTKYHLLRIIFWKALGQFNETYSIYENTGLGNIVDPACKLGSIVGKLAQIAPKLEKIKQIKSSQKRTDKIIEKYKEMIRQNEERYKELNDNTIKSVLSDLIKAVDPDDKLGFVDKIPDCYHPYLPDYFRKNQKHKNIE